MSELTQEVGADEHTTGPAAAPVTLVEYGDYQCPYCGQAHGIVQEVLSQREGTIRFVFRHFPLTQVHPFAAHAAEAAEAASAQGSFWEMHDRLYAHQDELDDASLVNHAGAIGLDVARFEADLAGHAYAEAVRADFMSGVRGGVNGTPSFFINGRRHDDAWDVESLLAAIDEAM